MAKNPNRKTNDGEVSVQVSELDTGEEEVLRQRIAEKAYALYECRGCCHGYDVDDWLEAERLVLAEIAERNRLKKNRREPGDRKS